MTLPKIIERPAQAYLGIPAELRLSEIANAADGKFTRLFASLAERRSLPSGAPFVRYQRIDMANTLDVEFGVPIAGQVQAAGDTCAGTLPAGSYAVSIHKGSHEGLMSANAALIDWAKQHDIELDSTPTPTGERFACRLETYLTDPRQDPNPANWQTELAIKVR